MVLRDYSGETALEQFHIAITAAGDPGMVASEGFDRRLSLYWHGEPNSDVQALIKAARSAGVTVAVNQRTWTKSDLSAARDRIFADASLLNTLGVSLLRFSLHADGIDVGLAHTTGTTEWESAQARLQAVAGGIPVHVFASDPVMD
ncbi:MAG: hypothetical protein QOG52_2960 [Frankiaceae bacterium]|nr:hypothetical protein [Frankiaceae bacterium]